MSIILHITSRGQWEQARGEGRYRGDTLESEGFIHCSTPAQVVRVANALFRGRKDLVLLCIDSAKVRPAIRDEDAGQGEHFPHVYGPLNPDAVVAIVDFPAKEDGSFELPAEIESYVGEAGTSSS